MQLELYNALKTQIETLTSLKYVALWNNQFERENVNVPFNYPCCFIEFADFQYSEYLKGVQMYTGTVRLHLGFKSSKTEDTAILTLKQDLNAKVFFFQSGYNTKLLRRSETQNFDHENVQEYIIDYAVSGKDYTKDLTNDLVEADIDTLDATVTPYIDNDIIKTGVLPD